ncbi:UNVERIFIED_CONTAM: Xaa-Pro dipeptidase [Sesamum calycinum]|uniref:Xaa-Pro dipeptidase n=1 Tax=Sesamum calycinum TaxID=2727403 RepID=A0AAW2JWL2_9LAMI
MEIWHCLTWELKYHFYGLISHVPPAVLRAHNAVISSMRPGVAGLAERTILESLKEGNLLFGDVDAMVHERLGAVFMPHGLGHLLGIDTHDPGGYLKGAERPKEAGLKSLRTSRELLEGMVLRYSDGCVNMTKCPREIQDIEAVMAGAPWPIKKSIPSLNGKI